MTRERRYRGGCFTLLCITAICIATTARARDAAGPIVFKQAAEAGAPLWLYRLAGYVDYSYASGTPPLNGGRVFVPECQAPCTTSLTPGTYRLGVGVGDDPRVLEVDGTLRLNGAETLVGRLESRSTMRTTGFVLLGMGLTAIAISAVIGISSATREHELRFDEPLDTGPGPGFMILLTSGAIAGIVGILLAAQPDAAKLSVQR